MLWLLQSVI
jgi:hypothetical protein